LGVKVIPMRDKDECLVSLIICTKAGGNKAYIEALRSYWQDGELDFNTRLRRLEKAGIIRRTHGYEHYSHLEVVR